MEIHPFFPLNHDYGRKGKGLIFSVLHLKTHDQLKGAVMVRQFFFCHGDFEFQKALAHLAEEPGRFSLSASRDFDATERRGEVKLKFFS